MSSENQASYTLRFDGSSDGNPGPAGAGVILVAKNGKVLYRFREGLGYQTNNAAEFHALILGMKQSIKKGYKNIIAEGDGRLVINQFQGSWTINDADIKMLRDEALELKHRFQSFRMRHIPENYNRSADSLAYQAIDLGDGQVEEESLG
ncbi:unnamed protein product [Vicia faba]|uniref:RNase H type-1 domain-containing protein n=1 Tax=Vicia faba TaxID=3906 RepID=A0AAV1ANY5_VICFA|nr:unnamed protein product [Vicia faba]